MNAELLSLAAKVEAAAGGSSDDEVWQMRELNDAIHELQPQPKVVVPPDYCRSIDAALTLVPEGLHWTGQTDRDGAVMTVGKAHSDARGIFYTNFKQATAATPALALCSAALKARAAEGSAPK